MKQKLEFPIQWCYRSKRVWPIDVTDNDEVVVNEIMQELDWWMTVENERRLLFWMSCGMIVCGLLAFVVLLMIPAPYGRYSSASWGWLIDSRAAWFMQELPSLLVPVILWPCSDAGTTQPNRLLLGAFIVHYIHRFIRFIWHYCSFMHTSNILLWFYGCHSNALCCSVSSVHVSNNDWLTIHLVSVPPATCFLSALLCFSVLFVSLVLKIHLCWTAVWYLDIFPLFFGVGTVAGFQNSVGIGGILT